MVVIPSIRSACVSLVSLLGLLLVAPPSYAGYLNLTDPGLSGFINGAEFIQGATLSGTGRFPAFVQVADGGSPLVHEAFNTTVNNVLDNGSSNNFNHEVSIADLHQDGTDYSFFLDINESAGGGEQYLSMDELRIYVSATPNLTTLAGATLVYDMDAGDPTNGVALDFSDGTGSGRADMELRVPVSLFAAYPTTYYVYLYSKFGVLGTLAVGNPYGLPAGVYSQSDGFEEWALGLSNGEPPETVPEPGSMLLLGLGLAAAARHVRRRRTA